MSTRYFKCFDLLVLDSINFADICTQAEFKPECPVILEAGQRLELTNGEFYIGEIKIEGRWTDIRTD
jgi:hypothetical protein